MTDLSLDQILGVLSRYEVEFVVVGGIAAILHGSSVTTQDLDVVYQSSPENLERLLKALRELEAEYDDPAGRRFEPDLDRLQSLRIHLLRTKHGRLDLLRAVGKGQDFEDLIARSSAFQVGEQQIRVLDLPALIEVKEQTNRPKDRHQLLFLRQLLAEIQRSESE
ncbi:MAG: DUF6036 family nucleotidyltransferase [Acidobacteriota bacterium]|nr:DUF6036 family nucleotidyltransferase [Acidobacteriota bacterium]